MKNTLKASALAGALVCGAASMGNAATTSSYSFDPTISLYSPFVYSFELDSASTVAITASSTETDPFYALFDLTDGDGSATAFTPGDESGSYVLGAGLYSLFVSSMSYMAGDTNVTLSISPVPLPAGLPLLATALLGAGLIARRRKRDAV